MVLGDIQAVPYFKAFVTPWLVELYKLSPI